MWGSAGKSGGNEQDFNFQEECHEVLCIFTDRLRYARADQRDCERTDEANGPWPCRSTRRRGSHRTSNLQSLPVVLGRRRHCQSELGWIWNGNSTWLGITGQQYVPFVPAPDGNPLHLHVLISSVTYNLIVNTPDTNPPADFAGMTYDFRSKEVLSGNGGTLGKHGGCYTTAVDRKSV